MHRIDRIVKTRTAILFPQCRLFREKINTMPKQMVSAALIPLVKSEIEAVLWTVRPGM